MRSCALPTSRRPLAKGAFGVSADLLSLEVLLLPSPRLSETSLSEPLLTLLPDAPEVDSDQQGISLLVAVHLWQAADSGGGDPGRERAEGCRGALVWLCRFRFRKSGAESIPKSRRDRGTLLLRDGCYCHVHQRLFVRCCKP